MRLSRAQQRPPVQPAMETGTLLQYQDSFTESPPNFLKPAVRPIDRRDDPPATFGANRSAPVRQTRLLDRVKEVALAQGWPIQAVVCIQNHFVGFGLPGGSAGGA